MKHHGVNCMISIIAVTTYHRVLAAFACQKLDDEEETLSSIGFGIAATQNENRKKGTTGFPSRQSFSGFTRHLGPSVGLVGP